MTTTPLVSKQSRLREILDAYCIKREQTYTLASGAESGYFFQGKLATLSPEGALLAGELFFEKLRGQDIDAVGGKAIGADPIVTAVALVSELAKEPMPAFIVRPERKGRGLNEVIAQSYTDDGRPLISPGRRVAIVDDVATTGQSCMDAVEAVEAEGATVAKVIVLVDRQQGAEERFLARGIPFERLYWADHEGRLSIA